MPGPKYSIKAHDTVIGAQSQALREKILKQIPLDQPNKTSQLHTVLNLAVGERTDISLNIRTDDGLTNGAGNIIKLIQTQETGKPQVLFGYNLIALMLVRKQDMIIDISICKALNLHGHPLNQLHHSLQWVKKIEQHRS